MNHDIAEVDAEGALSPHRLSKVVHSTCQKLLDVLRDDEELGRDLADKFELAISDIVSISISSLEPEFGAFKIQDGDMILNEEDVARLFSYVLSDMRAHMMSPSGQLDPSEIEETLHDTLSLFVLHELRHRTQGVGNFSTVQLLKSIDGREHISKFDIQADRDAAMALAAARTCSKTCDEFLEYYQRALYYSVQYFFKLYPANRGRLDKTCRVAALLLMLARLQIYLASGAIHSGSPTDAIHVKISADRRSIAIFGNEPYEKLLVAANDVSELPGFVQNIEAGDLDQALSQAIRLTVSLGLT